MLTRLLVAALAMLMISGSATAESPSELVGTWTLVSSVMEKDGKKTEQFGPGAHGMMPGCHWPLHADDHRDRSSEVRLEQPCCR